jgi:hypothetical protein
VVARTGIALSTIGARRDVACGEGEDDLATVYRVVPPLCHGCTLASLLLHLGTRLVAKVLVGARQSCRSLPPHVLVPRAVTPWGILRVHFFFVSPPIWSSSPRAF